MHLAAGLWIDNEDMRVNKNIKIKIKYTSGEEKEKSLRFGLD